MSSLAQNSINFSTKQHQPLPVFGPGREESSKATVINTITRKTAPDR